MTPARRRPVSRDRLANAGFAGLERRGELLDLGGPSAVRAGDPGAHRVRRQPRSARDGVGRPAAGGDQLLKRLGHRRVLPARAGPRN